MAMSGCGRVVAGVALLVLATTAHGADYWVENGGNDGLDGSSAATAWATLGHAADAVAPGDTVHVLDGSYQGFYLETSGTPGNPITFKAEGSAVEITADNPVTPDGINLEGASHVVIDGFVVNDRTRTGIRAVLASFVTIRNCRLGHNGRWGILTGFVDDFLAENNEAHHSQIEHGIYVSNSCDRPIVRNNHVHDNHANGLHFNGDASLGGDGLIENALVEGNVIHGNGAGGGSGINMDGGVNGVIRNNLLYDNHASASACARSATRRGRERQPDRQQHGRHRRRRALVHQHPRRLDRQHRPEQHPLQPAFVPRAIVIDDASRPSFVSDYNSLMDRLSPDGDATILDLADWRALG
jgi:hypothetical protein